MPKRRKFGKITRKKQNHKEKKPYDQFSPIAATRSVGQRGAFRNNGAFAFVDFDSFCRIAAGVEIHRILPDDKR
jgi:hypothetical protein